MAYAICTLRDDGVRISRFPPQLLGQQTMLDPGISPVERHFQHSTTVTVHAGPAYPRAIRNRRSGEEGSPRGEGGQGGGDGGATPDPRCPSWPKPP
jgi:hypothetical protein